MYVFNVLLHQGETNQIIVAIPIEYGKPGITVRKQIYATHGTTHPARKFPNKEKRKLRTGRGEGNPPKPKPLWKTSSRLQIQASKLKAARRHHYNHSNHKSRTHDSDTYHPSDSDNNSPSPHFNNSSSESISDSEIEAVETALMDVDSSSPSPTSSTSIPTTPVPKKTQDEMLTAQARINSMSPSKGSLVKAKSDFHAINPKLTTEMPSASWDNYSCWLDSSFEAIFCTLAFYGGLEDLEKLVATGNDSSLRSPIYYFYLALKFRYEYGLSDFKGSSHGPETQLTAIRNNFRQTLHHLGAAKGPIGEQQGTFVRYISFIIFK